MSARVLVVMVVAACHARATTQTLASLRTACSDGSYWDGTACRPRGDAASKLAASAAALKEAEVDTATAAIDAAANSGPLDHTTNVTIWKQRGIAAAYVDDVPRAKSAFEMLLALDPGHFLSYLESPKATAVFEAVRNEQATTPIVDVNWANGQKVGEPVPVDVTVIADPKQFLDRATLFVRTRGEASWRAADMPLGTVGTERHVVLPAITATRPVSLELYLRAYDERGNEVLAWADPKRPREIPLRYDPPRPLWQRWWVITLAGSVAVLGTGAIVYAVTQEPPDRISGSAGTIR